MGSFYSILVFAMRVFFFLLFVLFCFCCFIEKYAFYER